MSVMGNGEDVRSMPLRSFVDPVAVKVIVRLNREIMSNLTKLIPEIAHDDTFAFCSYTKPIEAVEKSLSLYVLPNSVFTLAYAKLLNCSNIECKVVKYNDLDTEGKFRILKQLYTSYVTLSFRILDIYDEYLPIDEVSKLYGEAWYWVCVLYFQMRDLGIPRYRIEKEVGMVGWYERVLNKLYEVSRNNREVLENVLKQLLSGRVHNERTFVRFIKEVVSQYA